MRWHTRSSAPVRLEVPLAPMLAVIFLLVIFLLLNLRIVTSEGSFNVNMPITAPSETNDQTSTDYQIGLRSDRDGNLTQVTFRGKNLGHDEAAFDRLNDEIRRIIGRPGTPLPSPVEVEIDADFETQYKYVVKAISKCTGRYNAHTKQNVRFVEKVKFAAPHKPKV